MRNKYNIKDANHLVEKKKITLKNILINAIIIIGFIVRIIQQIKR